MPAKMAKCFITTALLFLFIGCIEGLMFPAKFQFKDILSAVFHVPPETIKSFFGYFVSKIHTHINLIGWVSSALMGLLYFVAPQISGTERYAPWAAYGNWICHTGGIVLLAAGFHLIGAVGLSTGHEAGSPEFRSATASCKLVVMAGGAAIIVSACLFIFNILRTLFARPRDVDSARGSIS